MSFYDDASLVFLPSGEAGKDGKAYSMKPTNGNGDFTFSRGSNLTATRVDSNGLIEKGRENLLTYSNDFSNVAWGKSSTSVTSGQAGYDGSSDAWLLEATNTTAARIQRSTGATGVATLSFFGKSGTTDWVRLNGGNSSVWFNLSNGTIGTLQSFNLIDYSIEEVATGWYRCILVTDAPSFFRIYPANSDGGNATIGDNVYIQDAQLEIGLVATEYIESGATTGLAGILEDSPRFDYSGGASCPSLLLEPSRTNLVKYSEYFGSWNKNISVVTNTNETIDPSGYYIASKLLETTSSTQQWIYQSASLSGVQTFSVYAKAAERDYIALATAGADPSYFNLSTGSVVSTASGVTSFIESAGNGWYKCSVTSPSVTSSFSIIWISDNGSRTNYAGDNTKGVYVFGAQAEQGSYSSSYIPNHSGGSVTRNADVNTLLNQSGVIGQTAGTILFDAYFDEEGKVNFSISDSSANNFISIETTSSNEVTAKVEQGGSTQASITTATSFFAEGDRLKCAIAYDDRDMAFYINGTQVNTAAPNLIPACDDIRFGNYDGSIKADQRVNRVVLFDTRISNGNLATLTS